MAANIAKRLWEIGDIVDVHANVIVVSDVVDMPLYLESVQRGAFDFIVPPMSIPDFTYVVRSAVENALLRRQSSVQSPQPRS